MAGTLSRWSRSSTRTHSAVPQRASLARHSLLNSNRSLSSPPNPRSGWSDALLKKVTTFVDPKGRPILVDQESGVLSSKSGDSDSDEGCDLEQMSHVEAWQQGKLSFGFSAGGLLFPYFLGSAMALRDMGLLHDETEVAGASAGSLIAVSATCGLALEEVLDACLDLAADCRKKGTRFRLRRVLRRTLENVLPHDVHERCNGKAHVAVTQVYPGFKPKLINQYESRSDLVNALLTSCHIPWWMDGSASVQFREGIYVDGGLTNFLPGPPGTRCVRVCCFPSHRLRHLVLDGISIAPDLHGDGWPHSMAKTISWALHAAPEETLLKLVEKGRSDTVAWAVQEGFPMNALVLQSVA